MAATAGGVGSAAESPEARLRELGIELPQPPEALGSYMPVHLVGDLLYTSGTLPMWNGELRGEGVVGEGVTVSQASASARLCMLNILALVRDRLGSLDAVRQMVQLTGFVRSSPGFAQQGKVLNGSSDLLIELFGDRGRHTRAALGTTDLPMGAVVEITAIVRVFPDLVGRNVKGVRVP
ncbi:MAG: RidA family protein [Chloroflexi bacterium]|nr:MAG: RidA family protein [Chloroflexota bacterium]